jgi:L-lysine 2,3-aminomutase
MGVNKKRRGIRVKATPSEEVEQMVQEDMDKEDPDVDTAEAIIAEAGEGAKDEEGRSDALEDRDSDNRTDCQGG